MYRLVEPFCSPAVLQPLINALRNDVAAVRLWASGSLAEAGKISIEDACSAANQLLLSLQIDTEPVDDAIMEKVTVKRTMSS